MARFVPQKNLSLLIRAFVVALERGMKAKLLIVGKGPEGTMLQALTRTAPPQSIVFRDWTSDPATLLHSVDVYVLSSNYEGWGRVCIEALASGTPLIMTDVGCAGEVVEHGKNGIVVPVGDVSALADGLYTLATHKDMRERLIQEGLRTTSSLATFEENVALYIQSLKTCQKNKETE